jgi:hypothetical protein
VTAEGPARLYYDAGCGPCSFFARAAVGTSRGRLLSVPLADRAADSDLGVLSEETRYDSAHFVDYRGLRSGSEILGPLIGVAAGEAAERVVLAVPPIRHSLAWLYDQFWEYRRVKGCVAPTGARLR